MGVDIEVCFVLQWTLRCVFVLQWSLRCVLCCCGHLGMFSVAAEIEVCGSGH